MTNKPIGLYVHVPFCVKKCPYCDFYSVPHSGWKTDEYTAAVIRNLKRYGLQYDTVYFGGGTPGLFPYHIGKILAAADFTKNAEITVECNPDSADKPGLEFLKKSGANRLSFGVQSLSIEELSALGRTHHPERAKAMIRHASGLGFENISADLMLGIPRQTEQSLSRTIKELCELPITHISAYILKIEPNTVFGKKPPKLPDEDAQAALYLQAVKQLAANGFMQYEISNFARPGYESRHNLKYWRCEEYIGIGPAAHSFFGGKRYAVPRSLARFLENEIQPEEVTDDAPVKEEERIMLGLRLTEGIPLTSELSERLAQIPKHLYQIRNDRLSLTPEGFLVSNEIISLLI